MKPREAWELCGEPGDEAGIQNVRKRGAALRDRQQLVLPAPAGADSTGDAAGKNATTPGSSGRKKETFRLKTAQVKKRELALAEIKQAFDVVYAAATKEWETMVAQGTNGKGELSADGVAARFREQLPEGCYFKLTGRSLKHAVAEGRAGRAPGPRNHRPHVPEAFVQSIAQFAQMKQLNGDDQKPRQLIQTAVASAAGTVHESLVSTQSQKAYFLKRVRREMEIAVAVSKCIDDRRWQWLTSTNLTTWMRGYV